MDNKTMDTAEPPTAEGHAGPAANDWVVFRSRWADLIVRESPGQQESAATEDLLELATAALMLVHRPADIGYSDDPQDVVGRNIKRLVCQHLAALAQDVETFIADDEVGRG